MIDPNSISMHTRENPGNDTDNIPPTRQWLASLQLTTTHQMTADEIHDLAPDEFKVIAQDIEDRLRSAIWHHVYGDLEQPIMQLIMYAKRHQPQGVLDLELNQLIDKIIEMLTPGIEKAKE